MSIISSEAERLYPPGAQDRWPICKRLSERGRGETNHAGTATGNQGGGR